MWIKLILITYLLFMIQRVSTLLSERVLLELCTYVDLIVSPNIERCYKKLSVIHKRWHLLRTVMKYLVLNIVKKCSMIHYNLSAQVQYIKYICSTALFFTFYVQRYYSHRFFYLLQWNEQLEMLKIWFLFHLIAI